MAGAEGAGAGESLSDASTLLTDVSEWFGSIFADKSDSTPVRHIAGYLDGENEGTERTRQSVW